MNKSPDTEVAVQIAAPLPYLPLCRNYSKSDRLSGEEGPRGEGEVEPRIGQ